MHNLRYAIAGWIVSTFYTGGDMSKERPLIWSIANASCPYGIPDSW